MPVIRPNGPFRRADGWRVEFVLSILPADQTLPAVGLILDCFNTPMIDPRKATKGRRMSKKTRKKSPKSSIGRTTRAQPAASAKRPRSKSRKAPASNPGKNAKNRQPGSVVLEASHKPPSKALKLSSSAKTARSTAQGSKAKAVRVKPAKAEAFKVETSNPSLENARVAPAARSASHRARTPTPEPPAR